MEPETE
jgi:hypothetical protein